MLKIVCKIDPRDGHAEIAYRDPAARWGIVCYAHDGQHGEAHPDYFRTLRPAHTPEEHERVAALIAEFRGLPGTVSGDGVQVMKRLTH